MPKVTADTVVARPLADVFALTQDYGCRLEWDPFLRALRFLDGATAPAVGVRTWVRAWNGLTMTVEYVSYRPPEVVAVKMTEGPRLFASFGGVWRFADAGEGATEVTFEYGFRTRWAALRWALDPAIRWAFGRDIRARLRAVKRAAEETDLLDRLRAERA